MKLILALVVVLAVGSQALTPLIRTVDPLPGAPKTEGGKIINGTPATRGQFPHQAAVRIDGTGFCGGSLISTGWVMTAAHCAQGSSRWAITLGAIDQQSPEAGSVTLTTTNAIVHEAYNSVTLRNDIAVLQLPSQVTLTQFIGVVKLPARGSSNQYVGAAVTVSGWGKTSEIGGVSRTLNFVNLSVISNSVCAATYGNLVINAETMCCGAPNGDSTCNGDSGGPLILSSDATQVGVVSFVSSAGCGSGNPSGYERVTSHLDWIASNTGINIP